MRILIVEDNQEWQGLIKDVLDTLPCEIEAVSNYSQAQSALQQRAFNIITLDMELNDAGGTLSGWPLLRMLERGKFPESLSARVIVLSGSGEFQESPYQVGELLTKHRNVAVFLWKNDFEWDNKLYDIVLDILAQNQQTEVPDGPDPVNLRKILVSYFSESELQTLAFDLRVDYETLQGSGKIDKARGLVEHLERRDRLVELVDACRERRPNLDI